MDLGTCKGIGASLDEILKKKNRKIKNNQPVKEGVKENLLCTPQAAEAHKGYGCVSGDA